MNEVGERFVTTRSGVRVHAVEAGDASSPPVVFVPGWACTAWIFHETVVPLARAGFRAIAVELKGHGLSDKPTDPDEYTLESMRDHLLEVIDALEIENCGAVGHSMGAAVAVAAAARSPEKFARIALVAPVGFAGVRGMKFFRAITPRFLEPVFPHLATRSLVRTMLNVVYGSLSRPDEEDVEQFHAPVKIRGYTSAMRNLLHRFNWRAPYPTLSMPTMAVFGTEDSLSPVSDKDRYSSNTQIIKGAGHVLFDEAPEEMNRLLADFFAPMTGTYISGST